MDAPALHALIISLERELLAPATRADPDRLATLLAPDFTEIGQSGTLWSRPAMLAALAAESSSADPTRLDRAVLTEASVREVGPALFLLTYLLAVDGSTTRRSSLWRLTAPAGPGAGPGAEVVFHQGTRVPPR